MIRKKIFLLISFLSLSCWADNIQVSLVRGKVKFINSSKEESIVTKGMVIESNGMIQTEAKSFVRLSFKDGSLLNIGPKSLMALNHQLSHKPKLIEMIRGQVRGMINPKTKPEKGYDHKMIVKTRSASIGVRGTDFVVIYNDKNLVTSNITLKGEVDLFKKTDEEIYNSLREEWDEKDHFSDLGQSDELIGIEEDLRHHKTKRIPIGHFSGAFPSYEGAHRAIKISDQQLLALSENKSLKSNDGKRPKDILSTGIALGENQKISNSDLIPEPMKNDHIEQDNYNSKDSNNIGIKDGGYVDLNTGIYIAPPEGSPRDDKSGKFVMPDDLGGIDPKTGEYFPPRGVLLDPLHGFKYDETIPKDRDVEESLEKLKKLNGNFSERVEQILSIFKEMTRLDLYGFANYKYTTRVIENYFGEFRRVTSDPSM